MYRSKFTSLWVDLMAPRDPNRLTWSLWTSLSSWSFRSSGLRERCTEGDRGPLDRSATYLTYRLRILVGSRGARCHSSSRAACGTRTRLLSRRAVCTSAGSASGHTAGGRTLGLTWLQIVLRLVVVTGLQDDQVFAVYEVHQPMLFIDPP